MSAAVAAVVPTEVGRWRKRIRELDGKRESKQAQHKELTARHGRQIALGDDDAAARKLGALAHAAKGELADISHGLAAAGDALAVAEQDAAAKAEQDLFDEITLVLRERAQIAAKADRAMRTLSKHFRAMADMAARAEALQGHAVNRPDNPLNVLAVINRSTLFAGGIGLDRWIHTIPEKGSIAEWPESFAADEQTAQERYLETTK